MVDLQATWTTSLIPGQAAEPSFWLPGQESGTSPGILAIKALLVHVVQAPGQPVLASILARIEHALLGQLNDDGIFCESEDFKAWYAPGHVLVEDGYNYLSETSNFALIEMQHFAEFARWAHAVVRTSPASVPTLETFELSLLAEGTDAQQQFLAMRVAAGLSEELCWDDTIPHLDYQAVIKDEV